MEAGQFNMLYLHTRELLGFLAAPGHQPCGNGGLALCPLALGSLLVRVLALTQSPQGDQVAEDL